MESTTVVPLLSIYSTSDVSLSWWERMEGMVMLTRVNSSPFAFVFHPTALVTFAFLIKEKRDMQAAGMRLDQTVLYISRISTSAYGIRHRGFLLVGSRTSEVWGGGGHSNGVDTVMCPGTHSLQGPPAGAAVISPLGNRQSPDIHSQEMGRKRGS
ncbi:hypothetical protein HOY82DRAFT_157874 [Tuber indicum]|nr:hypothetical protein HOY82DRAFT_157874 [Tuber indicum]